MVNHRQARRGKLIAALPSGAHHRHAGAECNGPGDKPAVCHGSRTSSRLASIGIDIAWDWDEDLSQVRGVHAMYIGGGIIGLILIILLILWLTGNL
jgi:hypothetical protein